VRDIPWCQCPIDSIDGIVQTTGTSISDKFEAHFSLLHGISLTCLRLSAIYTTDDIVSLALLLN
jgi:hypothetical protein